jgi:hypothetical protein
MGEQSKLAEAILDQVADAVICADRSGAVIRWNRACIALFGFSAEEALGQSLDLYGLASSQYNRLKFLRRNFPELGADLVWEERKELTGGFGSVHLGPTTWEALRNLSRSDRRAKTINHSFGEGASPRLRQLREGLQALGIDPNHILHHDTPRLFFGCRLRSSAFGELLGLASESEAMGSPAPSIARAWRRRWLSQRVQRDEVMEKLRSLGPHTLMQSLKIDAHDEDQFELPLFEADIFGEQLPAA